MFLVIKVHEDYPTVVVDDSGWRTFVAIHNEEFLRMRKVWRERLAQSHPDMGGSFTKFVKVRKEEQKWLEEERKWYDQHKLPLPKSSELKINTRKPIWLSHGGGGPLRVLSILQTGGAHSRTKLVAELGLTPEAVATAVGRLRNRGARIVTIKDSKNSSPSYLLLDDNDFLYPHMGRCSSIVARLLSTGERYTLKTLCDKSGAVPGTVRTAISRLNRRKKMTIIRKGDEYFLDKKEMTT